MHRNMRSAGTEAARYRRADAAARSGDEASLPFEVTWQHRLLSSGD
jgi:hypothetical protein